MKKLILTLFSALSLSAGAQTYGLKKECPPELYNRIGSLIVHKLYDDDKDITSVDVEGMRIDSLRESYLTDMRFFRIFQATDMLKFGIYEDMMEDKSLLTGEKKDFVEMLDEGKDKMKKWESEFKDSLGGYMVVADIRAKDMSSERYAACFDSNFYEAKWVIHFTRISKIISSADFLRKYGYISEGIKYTEDNFDYYFMGGLLPFHEKQTITLIHSDQ